MLFRSAGMAGLTFPDGMPLPERLKNVQAAMAQSDAVAEQIYVTLGMHLGYSIPWYRLFYDFGTILLLGRVTSGAGGEIIVSTAQKVMRTLNCAVDLMMPDEKARRVGQCVAAASLPRI